MNTIETVVDTTIRDAIPGILADYLLKIIAERPSVHGIRLVPGTLGSGEIQVIVLETPTGDTMIRVFGFMPVNFKLEVERDMDKITLLTVS